MFFEMLIRLQNILPIIGLEILFIWLNTIIKMAASFSWHNIKLIISITILLTAYKLTHLLQPSKKSSLIVIWKKGQKFFGSDFCLHCWLFNHWRLTNILEMNKCCLQFASISFHCETILRVSSFPIERRVWICFDIHIRVKLIEFCWVISRYLKNNNFLSFNQLYITETKTSQENPDSVSV